MNWSRSLSEIVAGNEWVYGSLGGPFSVLELVLLVFVAIAAGVLFFVPTWGISWWHAKKRAERDRDDR